MNFDDMAKIHGLDLNKNANGYLNPKTQLARIFYDARQAEIDKLVHDLASEKCACNIFQHLAGKELERENN